MIKIGVGLACEPNSTANAPFKQWKFPGGETGVQLVDADEYDFSDVSIQWDFESNDEFFTVANLCDAIRHIKEDAYIHLFVPYLPYARQDRVCNTGESFALNVFGKMLNALEFNGVTTLDAHSGVAYELIDNFNNIEQSICASNLPKYDYFIAPDAGAAKKIYSHRQVNLEENPTKVIVMSKSRIDGKVVYDTPTEVIPAGSTVCVVDDLCDGGATFEGLAVAFNEQAGFWKSFDLYVTHGLFSKGTAGLNFHYDTIYTLNLINKSVVGVKELNK